MNELKRITFALLSFLCATTLMGQSIVKEYKIKEQYLNFPIDMQQDPQMVKFELNQKATDKIDKFKEGQIVSVSFNVRGREWTNKNNEVVYFVSLNAWKIEADEPEPVPDDLPF